MTSELTRTEKLLLWLPGHSSVLEKLPNNDEGNRLRYKYLKPISAIAYGALFCLAVSIAAVIFGILVITNIIHLPHMIGLFIVIPASGAALVFTSICMCQKGKQIQFDIDYQARPFIQKGA